MTLLYCLMSDELKKVGCRYNQVNAELAVFTWTHFHFYLCLCSAKLVEPCEHFTWPDLLRLYIWMFWFLLTIDCWQFLLLPQTLARPSAAEEIEKVGRQFVKQMQHCRKEIEHLTSYKYKQQLKTSDLSPQQPPYVSHCIKSQYKPRVLKFGWISGKCPNGGVVKPILAMPRFRKRY